MANNLVGVKEFAKARGVTVEYAYVLIRKGECPPHAKIGKTVKFRQEEIDEWIESFFGNMPADS